MVRSFDEEMKFLDKITPTCWKIKKGFVPNMNVCTLFTQVYCARGLVTAKCTIPVRHSQGPPFPGSAIPTVRLTLTITNPNP